MSTRFHKDKNIRITRFQNFCATHTTSRRDEIAELESDIEISRREFAEGKGIPNDEVFDRLHAKLLAMKQARATV